MSRNVACGPSGVAVSVPGVLLLTVICSDEACAEELELLAGDVRAADTALCDCGCAVVLLAVAEWEPATALVAA